MLHFLQQSEVYLAVFRSTDNCFNALPVMSYATTKTMLHQQPFDIVSLHDAYRRGLSPHKVIAECYRRVEAVGDPGIFLHLIDQQTALEEAATLGEFDPLAKPLWGVPFVIKDNIDAAGIPTTAACPAYAYVSERDAFVVESLRRAGASWSVKPIWISLQPA